ncbi:cytochrome P450 [Polyporus arcularius HHB13444]|uniref:Cytochrome P450 n=1 Tax=Polyporus arcularius HHB13444 TaxID=1314778 RepID=A0A5C3PDQ1_9APHY|nr:cytochrome P450 [Polyporus arcularius HHB13444]
MSLFEASALCMFSPFLAFNLALVVFMAASHIRKRRRNAHLPPSPPSDPLIGHYRIFPRSYQAEVFFQWSKTYGDIFYLEILGRKIVIVNNYEMANELMDKRSANYSDRPVFPLFMNLGWGVSVTFLKYGSQFFKQRRILQQYLAKQEVARFRPIHTEEAHKMLKNIVDRPQDFDWLVRRFGAAVIMKIAYGHQIESDDDEYIKLTENVSLAHVDAGDPGTAPVDFFPSLQYLPWWFPGCWFNRVVHNWSWAIKRFHDYPFEEVQRKMVKGHAPPSFLLTYLEEFSKPDYAGEHSLDDLKHATGAIYAGGAETTYSTINTIILAMVLYPQVLKKGQEEIDRVVGSNRLPDFDDRENLPYIEAIFQEVLRWRPVVPLGIPHSTMEEDTYKGMLIPKGTMVFANAWAMAMDARVYHDPETFKPERFLPGPHGAPEQFPYASFGFGRRACPGRFLGMGSVWMAIASLSSSMNIRKAIGPDGKEITPNGEYTSGLSSFPKPFPADIRPRSEQARRLILSQC